MFLFLFPGGFCAWWKHNFSLIESYNRTFGTTPNAATFDPKFRESDLKLTKTPTTNSLSLIEVARSFIMTIS